MPPLARQAETHPMPRYMLVHSHTAEECRVAFAAWRGIDSPLRHTPAVGSCVASAGTHRIWWSVDAPDEAAAFAQLPPWVAARTVVERVSDLVIP
jgi:hypothetical protein